MKQDKLNDLERQIKEEYSNILGIQIIQNQETVYEKYFHDANVQSRVHIYSVTKSIVSILIGIAIDKGMIQGIDQKVLDFFEGYKIKRNEKTIQKITLKDIITMTAPYKYKHAPYKKYFTSEDWVKSSLDLLGGKQEVGKFRYIPLLGLDLLSGILVQSTAQPVIDFANENLFIPLQIEPLKSITFHSKEEQFAFYKSIYNNRWVADPKGVNTAGWGLCLSAQDMAKIGQLYLNEGRWKNSQIVSSKWVKESTQKHSYWEERDLNYGYLWWLGHDNDHGYAAMGDGGNIIYVNPNLKLVVAIASSFILKPKDRIEFIKHSIEPIFNEAI